MDKVKTLKHLVDAILEFAITSRSPDQFEVLEKSLKREEQDGISRKG